MYLSAIYDLHYLYSSLLSKKEFRHLVERFRQMKHHDDVEREQEFKRRRDQRGKRRLAIKQDVRLLYYKRVYLLAGGALIAGAIMTLGSVVKGLGEGSIFWTHREIFTICGPTFLGLGTILLMTATGLVFERQAKVKRRLGIDNLGNSFNGKKPDSCQIDINAKPDKPLLSREESSGSSATDSSVNRPPDRHKGNTSRFNCGRKQSEESEMDTFLDWSLSSGESTTAASLSFSAKWAALAKCPERPNVNTNYENVNPPKHLNTPIFTLENGSLPKVIIFTPEVCLAFPETNSKNTVLEPGIDNSSITEISIEVGKSTSI